jgi:hypothetical protein
MFKGIVRVQPIEWQPAPPKILDNANNFMGWPGVEPGRPFGLQIFAPLWFSPPRTLRVCGPDCALTV